MPVTSHIPCLTLRLRFVSSVVPHARKFSDPVGKLPCLVGVLFAWPVGIYKIHEGPESPSWSLPTHKSLFYCVFCTLLAASILKEP